MADINATTNAGATTFQEPAGLSAVAGFGLTSVVIPLPSTGAEPVREYPRLVRSDP